MKKFLATVVLVVCLISGKEVLAQISQVTVQNFSAHNVQSNTQVFNGTWALTPSGGGVYTYTNMTLDANPRFIPGRHVGGVIVDPGQWVSDNPGIRIVIRQMFDGSNAVLLQIRTPQGGWSNTWTTRLGPAPASHTIQRIDPNSPPFGPTVFLAPMVVSIQ